MKDFFSEYRTKPWPKLEIPPVQRPQLVLLIVFTAVIIAIGWYIWLAPGIRAEKFLICAAAIPVLFFLKSRWVTIVGLLSAQVVVAFLFMGNSDYAMMGILGLVGVIIAFESPLFVYVILVMWLWFEMSPLTGFIKHPLRIEFIIGFALLGGYIFKNVLKENVERAKIYFPEKLPILLFLGWAVLGYFAWCLEPVPSGWYQLKYLMIGILFFLISPLILNSEKAVNIAVWAWIFAGTVGSLSSFITEIIGYQPAGTYGYAWGVYSAALGMQHSWSASYLSFTFFVTLALAFVVKEGYKRLFLIGNALLITVAVYIQYARGAMVGMVGGFILFIIIDAIFDPDKGNFFKFFRRGFLVVSTGLLIMAVVYTSGVNSLTYGYYELFENPAQSNTMQQRYLLWETAFNMFIHEGHPIRGLGVGAFWVLAYDYGYTYQNITEAIEYQEAGINPHNLYVDTTLNYGIIGLVFFLWLILGNLKRLRRAYLHAHNVRYRYIYLGLLCGLLAFYFSAFFDFTVFIISRYWAFLGFSVAVLNIGKRMSELYENNPETV